MKKLIGLRPVTRMTNKNIVVVWDPWICLLKYHIFAAVIILTTLLINSSLSYYR